MRKTGFGNGGTSKKSKKLFNSFSMKNITNVGIKMTRNILGFLSVVFSAKFDSWFH